jgi:hypothetical protein
LRNISSPGLDREQALAELHRLAVLDVDLDDLAVVLGRDLVHELHGLDDAEGLALVHRLAHLDERWRRGLGGAVESPDDGRLHDREFETFIVGVAGGRGDRVWPGGGRWRRRRQRRDERRRRNRAGHDVDGAFLADAQLHTLVLEFELRERVLAHHVEDLPDLV